MNPLSIDTTLFRFLFSDGDLRKINIQGKEIIQRVYFAVRDEEWLNIEPVVQNFNSEISDIKGLYLFQLQHQRSLAFVRKGTPSGIGFVF